MFNLEEVLFGKNVRSGRKGAVGSSPPTVGESQGFVFVVHSMRPSLDAQRSGASHQLGRMTTLQKEGGGVRGVVAGEVIRRVTAKTIAQQLGPVVKAATVPFQCARWVGAEVGAEVGELPLPLFHHVFCFPSVVRLCFVLST